MKLLLILFICLLFNGVLFGQEAFTKLYAQAFSYDRENPTEIEGLHANLYLFTEKDFDSTDIEIFLTTPNFIEFVMGQVVQENNEHATYGMLYEKLKTFKNTPDFQEIKRSYAINKEIQNRPADYLNWEKDKELFLSLNVSVEELENIRQYIEVHSDASKVYSEVMIGYRVLKEEKARKNKALLDKRLGDFDAAINMDSLSTISKKEGKPILLYFTGKNIVNAKNLEFNSFMESGILQKLTEEFIFVALYIDSRKELPENAHFISKINGAEITTVGQKNWEYLKANFKLDYQPFFAAIHEDKNLLGTATYAQVKSTALLNEFLEKMLEASKSGMKE